MAAKEKNLQKRDMTLARLRETFDIGQRAQADPSVIGLFNAYWARLDAIYAAFDESHVLVSAGTVDETTRDSNNKLRQEADTLYFGSVAIYQAIQQDKVKDAPPKAHENPQVKLPKINLPTFNGNFKAWPTFYELFNSMIHSNSTLPKIEKFHYLLSSLEGEPRNLLKAITVADANYQDAYDMLSKRYQNRRKLAFTYWEELQAIRLKGETGKDLCKLLDVLVENVNLLRNLGFTVDNWDFVLFHTLVVKLESSLRQRFERTCSQEDIPSYKTLIEFLQTECLSLELSTSKEVKGKKGARGGTAASIVTNTEETERRCSFCKGKHLLGTCTKFHAKEAANRYQFVLKKGLCLNCLRSGHRAINCKIPPCETCAKRHHSLLHFPKVTTGSDTGDPVTALTNSTPTRAVILLATALVEVRDRQGGYQPIRVLLDSGSQANFVTKQCCHRLGLVPTKSRFSILGLGESPSMVTTAVSCVVRSRYSRGQEFVVDTLVLPKICGELPSTELRATNWDFLQGLPLADPNFNRPARIDMLLGAEIFGRALTGRRKEGSHGELVALETWFGWSVMGKVQGEVAPTNSVVLHAVVDDQLERLVHRFWQLDSFKEVEASTSKSDQRVEQQFQEMYTREVDGRFVVALPFKQEKPEFLLSREIAVRRFLSLERRLERDPLLYAAYREFMDDYQTSGHMSPLNDSQQTLEPGYFIPHHPVVRPDSQTTKVRVVFDASAKAGNGVSLNDVLEVGPALQRPICAILLRFRFHAVGFIADVKQMYRQILVRKEDRKYQRIVWRASSGQLLQEYELNTVTYGLTSSPYLAIRTLHELAKSGQEKYPRAAKVLLTEVYMDDAVTGEQGTTDAQSLQAELIQLLREGQFELRKWASNDSALLDTLEPHVENQVAVAFDKGEVPCVKVLGMKWWPEQDHFSYEVNTELRRCTKRSILSDLARIFDPLGLICPITFLAKALIQTLWVLGLDWDTPVPGVIEAQWLRLQKELGTLTSLQIPRYVLTCGVVSSEVHGFCDASEKGYAAVVYLRAMRNDSSVEVKLLVAKTKVAPLKQKSIPRLELCAAVLLTELLVYLKRECGGPLAEADMIAWSDSMIVLAWLRSQSHGYKPFVGNRIGYIQEALSPGTFRYVPTEWNPADVASRGTWPTDLVHHRIWWEGPQWLAQDKNTWPKSAVPRKPLAEDPECRGQVSLLTVRNDVQLVLEQFSSLRKLQAVIAWCRRFGENCQRRVQGIPKVTGPLSVGELRKALHTVIRQVQHKVFADELKRMQRGQRLPKPLQALNMFVDTTGLLRVGGRLDAAELAYDARYPILLPRKHVLTDLIIDHCHTSYLHPGLQTIHFLLRQNYWILSPKRAIRTRLKQCVQCFKVNPQPVEPLMGNLPPSRILEAKAFMTVGIDFGGPFQVRPVKGRGKGTRKMYVCVFVCHATKAIHIELVFDLTTDAFIAALRRFVARRGHCLTINCDRGTNFVGANRKLAGLLKEASSVEAIRFEFNPPRTPHFGGLFEAGIKSIKTHLRRVVGNQTLTIEEFLTLLAQIEAMLNSRPLWAVSSDVRDLTALSPGNFLMLEPLTVVPDPTLLDRRLNSLSRWQLVQRLQQSFWVRWKNEYLTTLNQRQKWTSSGPNLQEGALVLIKEEDVKPLAWELARVVKVHPGKDGISRVATVRSARGCFQRPIVRLCPLPTERSQA